MPPWSVSTQRKQVSQAFGTCLRCVLTCTPPARYYRPFWRRRSTRLRRISCRASPRHLCTAGSLGPLSPRRGRSRRGALRAPARRVDRSHRTSGNGTEASHAGRVGSRSISSRGTVDIRGCRHRGIARASPSVLDVPIDLTSIAVVSPQCQALPVRFRNEAAIDAAHFEAELVTIEADRSSVCIGPFAQAERPGYRRVDLGFAREEGEAENEFPVLNPPAAPSFPDTRPRGPVAKAQDKRPVWLQFPDRQRVIGCMPTGGIRPSADKGSLGPRQGCVEDVPANQHSENDE
jgi:hypothetical protein